MQVDPAVLRDGQGGLGDNPAVGDDRRDIRLEGGDARGGFSVHLACVDELNAELCGTGGDRRRRQDPLAAGGRIRSGQDGDDVESGVEQRVKGRNSDRRGAGEEDPHSAVPKLPKLEPTVVARLLVVCSVTAW